MADRDGAAAPDEEGIQLEHNAQMKLCDAIMSAAAADAPPEEMQMLIRHLVEYTEYHFASEQALMDRHDYDAAGPHLAEHQEMMKALRDWMVRSEEDEGTPAAAHERTCIDVRNWLTNHIGAMDLAFARFLRR